MDRPMSDAATVTALLNDAQMRIDLLTKQLVTQRKVIAELYEERDAAWAALIAYDERNALAVAEDDMAAYNVERKYKAVLAAARNGAKADDR